MLHIYAMNKAGTVMPAATSDLLMFRKYLLT